MVLVRTDDGDLQDQRFKVTVRKGKSIREEWRTIKDIILPLWVEVMAEAKPGQYLFAKYMKRGDKSISGIEITKYWWRHVKAPPSKDLGIDKDFYSMKHSNLDETAEILDAAAASKAAGHTTVKITKDHYLPRGETPGAPNNTKYQELNNVSKPTATRDLKYLLDKKIVFNTGTKGSSSEYVLVGSKLA